MVRKKSDYSEFRRKPGGRSGKAEYFPRRFCRNEMAAHLGTLGGSIFTQVLGAVGSESQPYCALIGWGLRVA
jgi:hypothetical protein